MTIALVAPVPRQMAFELGVAAPGAKLYFYVAGSSTPATTWSNADLASIHENTNPIVADSAGLFGPIYLAPAVNYDVVLKDASGVTIWSQPDISTGGGGQDVIGTAGEALLAGQQAYLSDGSGGKTAGRFYKGDSANTYSSTAPLVVMVPFAIAGGALGIFRLAGQITGVIVVAGTDYYVGTAGALVTPAPANARWVGRADSTTSILIDPNPPPVASPVLTSPTINTSLKSASALFAGICQGRLTLTSGTPITIVDVTGATSVFFTPYLGNNIGLYDGTGTWTLLPFAELTCALGTLTSGLPYDIFAYNNGGVVALRAPVAWTNGTTRATALVLQNGVYVKSGATTDRYLGTFYTTSTTQTEDSGTTSAVPPKRYLWNYYNRAERTMSRVETTNSYTYALTQVRQANGSANNQVNFVIGVAEVAFDGTVNAQAQGAIGGALYQVGLAFDVTNAFDATQIGGTFYINDAIGDVLNVIATLRKYPAVGVHFVAWVEAANPSGNTTIFSNNSAAHSWSGISASIWG